MGKRVLGVVINRRAGKSHELSRDDIEDFLDVPVIEEIPEDESVKESIRAKNPIVHMKPHSKASRSIHRIASLLSGEDYEPPMKWYQKAFPFIFD